MSYELEFRSVTFWEMIVICSLLHAIQKECNCDRRDTPLFVLDRKKTIDGMTEGIKFQAFCIPFKSMEFIMQAIKEDRPPNYRLIHHGLTKDPIYQSIFFTCPLPCNDENFSRLATLNTLETMNKMFTLKEVADKPFKHKPSLLHKRVRKTPLVGVFPYKICRYNAMNTQRINANKQLNIIHEYLANPSKERLKALFRFVYRVCYKTPDLTKLLKEKGIINDEN